MVLFYGLVFSVGPPGYFSADTFGSGAAKRGGPPRLLGSAFFVRVITCYGII